MMHRLTWDQVNAWRLSYHGLSPRFGRPDALSAVTRTGGIQAQVMSAAELALWARVDDLTQQDVQSALWRERTLVKTWAMRATLHLIAADELPLYVAARSLSDTRNWLSYFAYYGISAAQYADYLAAAPQILGSEPITRDQFARTMAEQIGVADLHSLVLSKGWGTPLKPLAWRGDLCFGPSQGRNVTFVHPGKWLGSWSSVEPYTALQEIARRYLRAYGPATPEGFVRWWDGGSGLILARKLFQSLADQLEAVDVEGWQAFALRETLAPMQQLKRPDAVNLLPLFDTYVLGLGRGAELEPLLAMPYQRQVFRPQGWISAVVLVDGYINGVWEYATRAAHTTVSIRMFSPATEKIRSGIEAEIKRLGAFLGTSMSTLYSR